MFNLVLVSNILGGGNKPCIMYINCTNLNISSGHAHLFGDTVVKADVY